MPLPVYFYYELRNTFLVHRSLNSAFCNPQIFGRLGTYPPENACDKWKLSKYSCENPTKLSPFSLQPYCAKGQKYYAPTGGAAAIMFNDSFLLSKNGKSLFWKEEGVISKRLQQQVLEPYEKTDNLCDTDMYRNTVKPIGWKRHICEMGGYRNITLLKWLESTTNKNFKKFYRILDEKKHPRGLMPGVYRLYVDNVCECLEKI
uniref:Uncharacterized protein n=1 Tax=Caenorhabditis japonica TaxID=281687 RepID=A0A8R1I366_CAEJA